MPGVSENITVRSIIGRFLEHARIFYFENGGQPKVFIGSADWMPRNFFRRIEVVSPVEDPVLRERIVNQLLAAQLADNTKSSLLAADGSYAIPSVAKGTPARNSQSEFMALALGESKRPRKERLRKQKAMTLKMEPRPEG